MELDDAVQELKAKNAAISWICLDRLFQRALSEQCRCLVLEMVLVVALDDDDE